MGLGLSKPKCTVDAALFKQKITNLSIVNIVIEELSKLLAKKVLPGTSSLARVPISIINEQASFLLSGDTPEDNGSSRFNAYVGFYKQMSDDQRREKGGERLLELIQIRSRLTTNLANLCP
jgi:hypothetical protein